MRNRGCGKTSTTRIDAGPTIRTATIRNTSKSDSKDQRGTWYVRAINTFPTIADAPWWRSGTSQEQQRRVDSVPIADPTRLDPDNPHAGADRTERTFVGAGPDITVRAVDPIRLPQKRHQHLDEAKSCPRLQVSAEGLIRLCGEMLFQSGTRTSRQGRVSTSRPFGPCAPTSPSHPENCHMARRRGRSSLGTGVFDSFEGRSLPTVITTPDRDRRAC